MSCAQNRTRREFFGVTGKAIAGACSTCCLFSCGAFAEEGEHELRIWTSKSGGELEASFVKFSSGKVQLKKPNGGIVNIMMNELSAGDQGLVRELSKPRKLSATETKSSASEAAASNLGYTLEAACGLYCGACNRTLRTKTTSGCGGCKSPKGAAFKSRCPILACKKYKADKLASCGECDDYPCDTIETFFSGSPRYELREKYLNTISKNGLDAWLAEMETRWTCEKCNAPYGYGDAKCPKCERMVYTAAEELAAWKKNA